MTSDDASAGVKDEETKKERQRRKEEEEKSKKGITLSLKEMEEAEIDSAGKKQTAEDLIQKEEQEEAAQSDSEEYMAQAG